MKRLQRPCQFFQSLCFDWTFRFAPQFFGALPISLSRMHLHLSTWLWLLCAPLAFSAAQWTPEYHKFSLFCQFYTSPCLSVCFLREYLAANRSNFWGFFRSKRSNQWGRWCRGPCFPALYSTELWRQFSKWGTNRLSANVKSQIRKEFDCHILAYRPSNTLSLPMKFSPWSYPHKLCLLHLLI